MTDPANHRVVGIDIGGANLKYAHLEYPVALGAGTADHGSTDSHGNASSRVFELWRRPGELADVLAGDLKRFGTIDRLAVTMTGELADCFHDRSAGVRHIVDHTIQAAKQVRCDKVWFYRVDGQFCDADRAVKESDLVAAANWHAAASWVAREFMPQGLLIDIGSTTTDIIPLVDGRVATEATTDFERLKEGSLVYVGCRRTPVCGLVESLRFREQSVRVMNELFATIDDARIVLGAQPERSEDVDSADGKPRTIEMSVNRLARMIGLDHRSVTIDDAKQLAHQVTAAASRRIHDGLTQLQNSRSPVIISGHGADLVGPDVIRRAVMLSDTVGPTVCRSAPAFAVAALCVAGNP